MPPAAEHRADWERLYAGYAAFYGVEQTAAMRATVWGWLHDPGARGRGPGGARAGGAGPSASPTSARSPGRSRPAVGGFLDDLFVAPEARGSGAAQALIEAVAARSAASAAGRSSAGSRPRTTIAAAAVYDRVAATNRLAHLRDQARLKLRLSRLAKAWPDLRRALQTALAATTTLALAGILHLPESSWAVVTAILVVQARIGGSLTLAMDRLAATLLGAVVGVATVTALGPRDPTLFAVLFVAVLALAYATSRKASLRLAPVTAAIVILADPSHGSPVVSAMHRVLEIGLGSCVALAVTLLVFPERAGRALAQHVAKILPQVAEHLGASFVAARGEPTDSAARQRLTDRVRAALLAGDTLADEARREVAGHLADHADPAALLRTLRRLWNTALMAARTTREPFPPAAAIPLRQALSALGVVVPTFLARLAAALASGAEAPDPLTLTPALAQLGLAVDELSHRAGFADTLQGPDLARLFTLSFAMQELETNLRDLADRCHDLRQERRGLLG